MPLRSVALNLLRFSLLLLPFCVSDSLARQIPASFRIPVLGYVLDRDLSAIRPIAGILGNARIEEPLDLGVPIREAVFLHDHRHAIVVSPQTTEILVAGLEAPFRLAPILGAPSSGSVIRTSRDGTKAALYYPQDKQLLIVSGLPDVPVVRHRLAVSLVDLALKRFAISDDGAVALLAFGGEESDVLYSWTAEGLRFITGVPRISDLAFVAGDGVVADSVTDQILLIRGVREGASPALIADSRDGITSPSSISVSSRNEIYIGNADSVSVISASGTPLQRIACECTVTTLAPLRDGAFRLTDQLNQPLWVLDGERSPERILFVPALAVKPQEIVP